MTEKLEQTIKEEIAELPREWQEAIGAVGWVKIAEEIGKGFELDEEEINDFQLETLLMLIGAVDPEFYAINIENHVETTKEKAENLAEAAFKKIFTPIRNILEEKIKEKMRTKEPDFEQSLNFILSGGNYAAMISPPRSDPGRSTPQEGNLV